jgi:4-amino-4-deoxy-L-arabinose transferase-like glycosyltransferase
MIDKNSKSWRTLTLLALAIFLLIGLYTASDYGISWDYEAHDSYGKWIAEWYQDPSADHAAVQHGMRCYGPFFEMWVQVARHVFFWIDEVAVKSATAFVFGILGALGTYVIGATVHSRRTGFLAAVMLILTPMYYGHSFINHKDLPLAVTHAWVLAALVRSLKGASADLKSCLLVGLALGLCLAIRMGAILVVGPIALGWAFMTFTDGKSLRFDGRTVVRNASLFALQLITAWGVIIVLWPYAMLHPIDAPLQVLVRSSSYPWPHTVLFEGQFIAAPAVSGRYIFVWFFKTLPEFVLFGIGLGVLLACFLIFSKPRKLLTRASAQVVTLSCSIVLPIAVILINRSVIYDAVRHLLFLVPPMVALVAIAFNYLLDRSGKLTNAGFIASLCFAFIHTSNQLISLHPFQYVYFNTLVGGGLPSAFGKFETEYWATCMKQSVEWLQQNLINEPSELKVSGWSDALQISWYTDKTPSGRSRLTYVPTEAEADIYLTTSRWNGHLKPYKLLKTIDRHGVPLCFIFDRRSAAK